MTDRPRPPQCQGIKRAEQCQARARYVIAEPAFGAGQLLCGTHARCWMPNVRLPIGEPAKPSVRTKQITDHSFEPLAGRPQVCGHTESIIASPCRWPADRHAA